MKIMEGTRRGEAEWLRAKLISLTGRIIGVDEMREAMGLKQSTYYVQLKEGRLISAENMKNAAKSLGVNELQLMIECGIISEDDLNSYNASHGWRRLPPPL